MRAAGLLLLLLLAAVPARAQGCAQCQDNLRQTPARTQAAYRHAILLMMLGSGCVFTTGLFALRRFR
jgi:hypothetical protein